MRTKRDRPLRLVDGKFLMRQNRLYTTKKDGIRKVYWCCVFEECGGSALSIGDDETLIPKKAHSYGCVEASKNEIPKRLLHNNLKIATEMELGIKSLGWNNSSLTAGEIVQNALRQCNMDAGTRECLNMRSFERLVQRARKTRNFGAKGQPQTIQDNDEQQNQQEMLTNFMWTSTAAAEEEGGGEGVAIDEWQPNCFPAAADHYYYYHCQQQQNLINVDAGVVVVYLYNVDSKKTFKCQIPMHFTLGQLKEHFQRTQYHQYGFVEMAFFLYAPDGTICWLTDAPHKSIGSYGIGSVHQKINFTTNISRMAMTMNENYEWLNF